MKATELMIGDWVFDTRIKANVKVVAIDSERQLQDIIGSVRVLSDDNNYGSWAQYLEPIPLTTEILEKNGFDVSDGEVMRYNFEEDGQSFHFGLRQMYDKENKPKGYSFYAFNVLTIIDFVHELQHALRLCGIDKNIER